MSAGSEKDRNKPWAHAVENAARMLADTNYPTEYEMRTLIDAQSDRYHHKTVLNLLAMLEEARDRIEAAKQTCDVCGVTVVPRFAICSDCSPLPYQEQTP